MFGAASLRDARGSLGALLTDRELSFEIAIVAGGGLLLLGDAISDIARLLGLPQRWLNGGPTAQLRFGLPEGFAARTRTEVYGGLTVRLASRFDQVCLKLYAATDGGRNSKHVRDLIEMGATREELQAAAPWVQQQDRSPEFRAFVQEVIAYVEATRG